LPEGQALTGNGTIIGPVVVAGTLAPTNVTSSSQLPYRPRIGTLPAPLLVVTNQLVLQGTTILPLLLDTPAGSHSIFVFGDLVCGGNLQVVLSQNQLNLIRPGTTYKLFNATRLTGTFDKIDRPRGLVGIRLVDYDGTVRAIGLGPPTPILSAADHVQQSRALSLRNCFL
jgi:hypothetical protein